MKKQKYLKYMKVHLRYGLCYRIEHWNTFEPNYVRRWFEARRQPPYWKGKTHRHLKYLKTFMPFTFPGQKAIKEWRNPNREWLAKEHYRCARRGK